MIKLLRIDERLIHGMVAVSWTSAVSPEVIVVANDNAAKDKFFSMTISLAKPAGVELRIYELEDAVTKLTKTGLRTKSVFLVVESLEDAKYLVEKLEDLNPVTDINVSIAGIRKRDGLVQVIPQLYLNKNDVEIMRELSDLGKNVFVQAVPASQRASLNDVEKKI